VEARELPGTFSTQALRGSYSASGFDFVATLDFSLRQQLIRVRLEVVDGIGCYGVQLALTQRYGRPVRDDSREDYADMEWRDEAGGNLVRFGSSPDPRSSTRVSCYVDYSPLPTAASGL
jgi:hypothetical protein